MAQGVALGLGQAERVVQVDAGDFQRLGIDLGAGGGDEVRAGGLAGDEQALFVQLDGNGGHFQQGVAVPVEAAGLHVHHHRQEAAEAAGHRARRRGRGFVFGFGGGVRIVSAHGQRVAEPPSRTRLDGVRMEPGAVGHSLLWGHGVCRRCRPTVGAYRSRYMRRATVRLRVWR